MPIMVVACLSYVSFYKKYMVYCDLYSLISFCFELIHISGANNVHQFDIPA